MKFEGPLGNVIDTTCATYDVCMRMAGLHRRVSAQLDEPCPDLLELAELWEQAAIGMEK